MSDRREGPNANESFQTKLRNRDKLAQEQARRDMAEIMKLPAGRRFMYDLIFERCGIMNVYPAQDSGIYRHEGRRSVGFNLTSDLQQFHGTEYTLMITERQRDLENERVLRSAAVAELKKENRE
jgi:hypothetical protein